MCVHQDNLSKRCLKVKRTCCLEIKRLMDRNVNLNLNILMSSANKDDLREGFNASEPHIPSASVCLQHKLLADISVNQR